MRFLIRLWFYEKAPYVFRYDLHEAKHVGSRDAVSNASCQASVSAQDVRVPHPFPSSLHQPYAYHTSQCLARNTSQPTKQTNSNSNNNSSSNSSNSSNSNKIIIIINNTNNSSNSNNNNRNRNHKQNSNSNSDSNDYNHNSNNNKNKKRRRGTGTGSGTRFRTRTRTRTKLGCCSSQSSWTKATAVQDPDHCLDQPQGSSVIWTHQSYLLKKSTSCTYFLQKCTIFIHFHPFLLRYFEGNTVFV